MGSVFPRGNFQGLSCPARDVCPGSCCWNEAGLGLAATPWGAVCAFGEVLSSAPRVQCGLLDTRSQGGVWWGVGGRRAEGEALRFSRGLN